MGQLFDQFRLNQENSMKTLALSATILLSFFCLQPVMAEQQTASEGKWNYAGVFLLQSNDNGGGKISGLGVDGNYEVAKDFEGNAAFLKYHSSDADYTHWELSLNYHFFHQQALSLFGGLGYANTHYSFKSFDFSGDIKTTLLRLGLANRVDKIDYRVSLNHRSYSEAGVDSDNGIHLEAYYELAKEFSAGGSLESVDGDRLYTVGIRKKI